MPHIEINGSPIYYQSTGKGIPIIFIHPPVLTSLNFVYQIRDLASFFQVITFDIRGHGKSPTSKDPLTYPLIVSDIKGILDALHINRAFICGYSMGGSIALEFMLSYPERVWGGILLSGLSEVNDRTVKNQMALGSAIAKAGGVSSLAFSISWTNADDLTLFYKLFRDAKKSSPKEAREYYQYGMNYNCTPRLRSIQAPVFLLNGAKDKLYHPYAKLMMEYLPHTKWKTIENVKHHLPTKSAIEVNDLIKQFIYTHREEKKEETTFYPVEAIGESDDFLYTKV